MKKCLICASLIEPFMSFGKMPIANGFLTQKQFDEEYFYDLKIAFCEHCKMVQLTELIDREQLFHENYAFYSSTSSRMVLHFQKFADEVMANYLKSPSPFVAEIGSNDGIMLQNFSKAGIRHLGIEPSANVAHAASLKGIQILCQFFDENLARDIVANQGQADVILGANVMCHIPYLHSVAEGAKILLKPMGVLIFEDPYLGDIIEKTAYDQIYDEHAFYFSLTSISYLFEQHELEVVDAIPQEVHGGSMRYVIAHKGMRKSSSNLHSQLAKEKKQGLDRPETYARFRQKIESSRDELQKLLRSLKDQGKRVVGYGATSKSTTVTNYCRITPELIEFINDTTPIKQGKFSPGVHIPVRPYAEFAANYPDYSLLFAWNHAEEIMEKEKDFQRAGGKWIVYVPKVEMVYDSML